MAERSTIYLDVDDDITSVIGKLTAAEHEMVALVIPKRSSVLQSVVNQKLVKKAAREASKKPVLITEDPVITNIGGGQQMLVAANLQAEPKVPEVEKIAQTSLPSDVIEGEALGAAAVEAAAKKPVDDEAPIAAAPSKLTKAAAAKAAAKKRVPDFGVFKKRFMLALIGIVGGGFLLWTLFFWLPKANIAIAGQTEPTNVAFSFTADTEVKNPQYNNSLLPAKKGEISKTLSQDVNPTGKKDVGTKATGTVSIKNCQDSSNRSYSAGTKFTSSSGKTFSADSGFDVSGATVSGGSIVCGQSGDVPVTAAENGSSYNMGPTSYSSPSFKGNYTITGSEMSGGTSKTVTVVTQGDVDAARKELLGNERKGAKEELRRQFDEEKDYIIEASYKEDVKKVTSDPGVGEEADSDKLTVEVVFEQIAVQKEYLDELVKREGDKSASPENDSLAIVNSGLDTADFKLKDKTGNNSYRFNVKTQALLGPDINFDDLRERIAGKKFSEAVDIVKSYPNVSGAEVDLSPFYVRKVPRNANKIHIEIKIPEN